MRFIRCNSILSTDKNRVLLFIGGNHLLITSMIKQLCYQSIIPLKLFNITNVFLQIKFHTIDDNKSRTIHKITLRMSLIYAIDAEVFLQTRNCIVVITNVDKCRTRIFRILWCSPGSFWTNRWPLQQNCWAKYVQFG